MNIPILEYVDVLIGLSLVMLIIATVALSISQALLNMSASRARHLARGLEPVFRQLHPALLGAHAPWLSQRILLHPVVCQPRSPLNTYVFGPIRRLLRIPSPMPGAGGSAPGTVILREELAICVLEWAAGEGGGDVWTAPDAGADADAATEQARATKRQRDLVEALSQRGIGDPAATLRAFRLAAMANETAHPELSAQLWRSQALVQVAPTEFVATLYQSFDTAMSRATASFGAEAQIWVSVVALVIVALMQVDTFTLVRRLSLDDSYRQTLVDEARRLDPAAAAAGTGRMPVNDSCAQFTIDTERQSCEINRSLNLLHTPALDLWPESRTLTLSALPGIVVTWLLVSLGAPFWYDLLKNLFQLRSVLAQRDQSDRTERTTPSPSLAIITKPADPALSGVRPPGSAADDEPAGEMGNLSATGAHG